MGIASVDRFEGAPAGHGPRDFIPKAESVISIGIRLPDAVVDRLRYLADADYAPELRHRIRETHIYTKQGYALPNLMLDEIAYRVATMLEMQGYRTLPVPATMASYTMPDLNSSDVGYFGIFSHRHAAVRAGLGEFGYNNIVVTTQFGPRVRYTSIITTAPLDPDPLVGEPICRRDACRRCLEACPAQALSLRSEALHGIFLNPPSRTAVLACVNRPDGTPLGTCLAVCPVGEFRTAAP